MKDAKLVYSSDEKVNIKCPKCKELLLECVCIKDEDVSKFKGPVAMRLEKQGRGGKLVTVIDRFPKNETYLKNLSANLKKRTGTGGTYLISEKSGVIELQGDKRELVRALLTKEGITVKG